MDRFQICDGSRAADVEQVLADTEIAGSLSLFCVLVGRGRVALRISRDVVTKHGRCLFFRAVRWRDGTALDRLAGRVVRLRFVLSDSDLYGFRMRRAGGR